MRKVMILVAAVTLCTWGAFPVAAGTPDDPEITDVAGDANFINGQGVVPGHEDGPDTRPASLDGADLRAVWFTTDYVSSKVLDPETDAVLRVEYAPTGLRIHLRTEAPIHPTPQNRSIRYRVIASLPGCRVRFELWALGESGAIHIISRLDAGCPSGIRQDSVATSSNLPSFDGNVATFAFPFSHQWVAELLSDGLTIPQPAANVVFAFPDGAVIDEAASGRSFTVGSDVPPDVDCTAEPGHPECQT